MADRANVKAFREGKPIPNLVLSTQNVLSCGATKANPKGPGTCHGGEEVNVWRMARDIGIPHESCSNYMARDATCDDEHVAHGDVKWGESRPHCYNCDEDTKCYAIPRYHKLFTKNNTLYRISGVQDMKVQLMKLGPLSCSIYASKDFERKDYKGDVFAQDPSTEGKPITSVNHVVEVTGWGVDEGGNEYWHVRNRCAGTRANERETRRSDDDRDAPPSLPARPSCCSPPLTHTSDLVSRFQLGLRVGQRRVWQDRDVG